MVCLSELYMLSFCNVIASLVFEKISVLEKNAGVSQHS